MADAYSAANRWIYATGYLALMALIVGVMILPVEIVPSALPGPDLMIAVTLAWLMRRPQFLPTPLIAVVFLAADFLLMRAPGLMTALVVLSAEFLRTREAGAREQPFPVEWILVTGTLFAITLADWLVLTVFLVPHASLGLTLLQFVFTVLAYPAVVLVSRFVFKVEKMAPGEINAWGRQT